MIPGSDDSADTAENLDYIRKTWNFRYDPNLRYSLPTQSADTSVRRRMLRPLSHRCVGRRRTGFSARRRDSRTFRVHGVHSQGTTDADTALVGCSFGWMHGIGRRRHSRRTATDDAIEWKPGPSGIGDATESIQHIVWAGSAKLFRDGIGRISAGRKRLAEYLAVRRATGGFHSV